MTLTSFLHNRWTRRAGWALACYALFALLTWWGVPAAARRALPEVAKKFPGFTAAAGEVRFNPFLLAVTVRGFAFSHEQLGDIVTCEEFYASLQPLDLLRLAVGLREMRFTRPQLFAAIAQDGKTFLDYMPKSEPMTFTPRLVVHRLEVARAAMVLESRLRAAPQKVAADPINFAFSNLSTLKNDEGAYNFTARTDQGETMQWTGKLTLRPARLSGRIVAAEIDASREDTAAPGAPVAISAGRVNVSADYELSYDEGILSAGLSNARLGIRGLHWALRGSAEAPRGPFAIEAGPARLDLRAPLPPAPGQKVTLAFNSPVAGSGLVDLKAALLPKPLSGTLRLLVEKLPLAPFSPLTPPPTQVSIDSGTFSLDASATATAGMEEISAKALFSVDNFLMSDSASRTVLARFDRFGIEDLTASVKNSRVSIGRISLSRPYLRLFKGGDGRTNIESALGLSSSTAPAGDAPAAPPAEAGGTAAPGQTPWRLALKRFSLDGGKITVQDESVAPAFALTTQKVSAELSNLSTDNRSTAAFSAKGFIETAPFDIAGTVRVSSVSAWADARVNARGIQLTAFSPYFIKMAGYKLDKGTMDLDLRENLNHPLIDTSNKIVLDQLTLGEKVPSPDAMKIPVKLGIAILKDRHGVIDLDVPVSGSLDNPEFRLAPLILKTVVNLLVKAALSPFSALGKAMGSDADLSKVFFAAGAHELDPAAQAALDKVIQALADRPELRLGVRGSATRSDALAMGELALQRQLRGPDKPAAPLTPKELASLPALHAKLLGAPAASPEEARTKLVESMAAGPAEMRALAIARAGEIREYLGGKGLAAERFFSLDPAVNETDAAPASCELQLDV